MLALTKVVPNVIVAEGPPARGESPLRPDTTNLGFTYAPLSDKSTALVAAGKRKLAVEEILFGIRPRVLILTGYSHPTMRKAARWARKLGVPCIMTTDTTAIDRPRFLFKERIKGLWLKLHYDALFLPGERGVRYFTGLGFPEERMWRGASVVDNSFFEANSEKARHFSEVNRSRLKLPAGYFLTVARLSPEKNVTGLLRAFDSYRQKGGKWDLVIVGSGPQEPALRQMAHDRQLPGVHFAGWQKYEDLPTYYGLASCFVLASHSEPWGYVANEAMACGLPVLISEECGCVPELCRRGINGYEFGARDTGRLTRLMLGFSGGEFDLAAMGEASRRIVANFTPDTRALSLRDCILNVLERVHNKRFLE